MARRFSSKNLARSSAVVGFATVLRVATGIFIAPLLISQAGIEGYGVWALLFSISGTVGATAGSISLAYTKFTAEYAGRDEYDELAGLLGSGFLLIGGTSALGCLLAWLLRLPVLRALGVEGALLEQAQIGLTWVLAAIFVRLSIGCYRQFLAGLQRTDLTFHARILSSLVYFALAMPLLYLEHGIPGLAVAFFTGELVACALAVFQVRRIDPQLRISLSQASLSGMGQFFALGGRFQLLRVLAQISGTGFSMLLSALMGPAMLGTYELAKRLLHLGGTVSQAIGAPMMPAFAELHATKDEHTARRLYEGGSRLLFLSAVISLGFLSVFAERALLLWTGEPQTLSAWTIQVLAIAFAFNQLTAMGTSSLRGRGRVSLEMTKTSLAIGLHGLFLAPFYYLWGYQGFVASETLSSVAGTLAFLWYFSRTDALARESSISEMLWRPLLVMAPVLAVCALAASWLQIDLAAFSERWDAFVELAIAGTLFSLMTALACATFLLREEERSSLRERASRLLLRTPRHPIG